MPSTQSTEQKYNFNNIWGRISLTLILKSQKCGNIRRGRGGEEGEVKANKRGEVGTSSDNCQVSKENWECKLLQFLSSEKLERKQRELKFMTNQQFLFLVWKVWQGFWYLCDRLGKMSMVSQKNRRRSRFWCKEVQVNLAENANGNRVTVHCEV